MDESAYHDDPEQPDSILLGEMGFLTLCTSTDTRKPVVVKRRRQQRKKAP
ncbi:hypothetical protein PSE10B_41120 [Pseudomonas amygdali pv. eriobotryae]|nr:hypothetical protein PSE10B_41120 [Pseudomonas amygdali pv. eriobotryae]